MKPPAINILLTYKEVSPQIILIYTHPQMPCISLAAVMRVMEPEHSNYLVR